MLRRFVERTPAGLEPLAIEKWVGIDLGDLDVRGKVDRVDEMPGGRLRVVDYKTGRFPRDPARVREEDLAAAVYAGGASAAFAGMPVGAVEYLYLDTMESLEFPVGAEWQARKEQAIGALAREARDGEARRAFPPRPSKLCAWCDFRERCPEGQAFLDDRSARR